MQHLFSHLILSTFMLANPFQESINEGKEPYIQTLKTTPLRETWDFFLENQANLYFPQEHAFLKEYLKDAESVLDMGTGNGYFLHKLATEEPHIQFFGIDSNEKYITKAIEQYTNTNVSFAVGDAEVENPSLINRFDIVIFRLVLQHTKNPKLAMEQASKYLKKGGLLVVIDSYDSLKNSTLSEIPSVTAANKQHNQINLDKGMGNREISIEILKEVLHSKSQHYSFVFSNIDTEGQKICDVLRFHTAEEAGRLFHQLMLYLSILNKQWQIPVDFDRAYGEIWDYTHRENFSSVPGMHYMVIRLREPSF